MQFFQDFRQNRPHRKWTPLTAGPEESLHSGNGRSLPVTTEFHHRASFGHEQTPCELTLFLLFQ